MGRCICTGGKCYVFGGEVPGSTAPSITDKINTKRTVFSTDIYDIASDSWSFGPVRTLFSLICYVSICLSLHKS